MSTKPSSNPRAGDAIMGTTTFHNNPLPFHQASWFGIDQIITFQLLFAPAKAAPHKPPIIAWLELDGRPNHQVMRFQIMAPISVQIKISDEIAFMSTRPEVMVLATAVPSKAPVRLVNA